MRITIGGRACWIVFWGVGVVLKGVFVALGGLGDVGVYWRSLGSFKWCLRCFEGIVGGVLGVLGAFYGVLGAFGCVGGYNHSC